MSWEYLHVPCAPFVKAFLLQIVLWRVKTSPIPQYLKHTYNDNQWKTNDVTIPIVTPMHIIKIEPSLSICFLPPTYIVPSLSTTLVTHCIVVTIHPFICFVNNSSNNIYINNNSSHKSKWKKVRTSRMKRRLNFVKAFFMWAKIQL